MTTDDYLSTHGAATALEIRRYTKLSLEAIYERLVQLEAAGIVALRLKYRGKKMIGKVWVWRST